MQLFTQTLLKALGPCSRQLKFKMSIPVERAVGAKYVTAATKTAVMERTGEEGAARPRKRRSQGHGKAPSGVHLHTAATKSARVDPNKAAAGQQTSHPPSGGMAPTAPPPSHLKTDVLFEDLPIDAAIKQAIREVLQFKTCSPVQAATLPITLTGQDTVAKARTGTGKTISFLIPVVERILQSPRQREGERHIQALILSPTRELAMQIAKEAQALLSFHRSLAVQVVVGGLNINRDLKALERRVPDILVATPGRLIDHLTGHNLGPRLKGLQTLVMDEADRLLDMGFRPDINKILEFLPHKDTRQNLLFSATYPPKTADLCKYALREDYKLVDAVGNQDTHESHKVKQTFLVTPLDKQVAYLYQVIQDHRKADPYNSKIMIFCTTARLTQMYANVFELLGLPVMEMHSRKSQSARMSIAEKFRKADSAIMFSSDVSARGMDYPDVTLVVQLGLPSDRDQYIHRLGRTARAGKEGEGLLMLTEHERVYLDKLKDIPLSAHDMAPPTEAVNLKVQEAMVKLPDEIRGSAYRTWLGYNKGHLKLLKWSPEQLVEEANHFALEVMSCREVPTIEAKTVGKMGLKGVKGLRIDRSPPVPRGGRNQQRPRGDA